MPKFRSGRDAEVVYEATTETCTCPGFQNRGQCAHVEQLLRWAEWKQEIPEGILPPPSPPRSWQREDGPH